MTFLYNASVCPAVQHGKGTFLKIADAGGTVGNSPTGKNMAQGDQGFRQNAINPNLTAQHLQGVYGGGGAYCIALGLVVSIGTGLSVNISAGHAIMGAVVEIPAAKVVPIAPGLNPAYLWLQDTGAITYTSTTTPPAGNQCFLGSCVTNTTNVLSVDFSGVLYNNCGRLQRFTGDAGPPLDTPPAVVCLQTITSGGSWDWDGITHNQILKPGTVMMIPVLPAAPATLVSGMLYIHSGHLIIVDATGTGRDALGGTAIAALSGAS